MPVHVRDGYGIISFFAGIGGMDLGFERAGFRTWMASELHAPFVEGYIYSRACLGAPGPVRSMVRGGFEHFLDTGWRRLALLSAMGEAREERGLVGFVGGPPCPDFSVSGGQAGEDGLNGRLSQHYCDLICALQPDFFVVENVAGLWSNARHREFYRRLRRQFSDAGFHVADRLLNAINYGVAQDRERIIVVGFRERSFPAGAAAAMASAFPWDAGAVAIDIKAPCWPRTDPFGEDCDLPRPPGVPAEMTVEHWFRKNRVADHDNSGHFFRPRQALDRFNSIAEGDTGNRSFKRLHRWRYSPTAAYGNNEVHLHPYKPRRLSAAEAMAIQSFPRDFALPENMSLSDMFKGIGNAVPAALAQHVAHILRDTLTRGLEEGAGAFRKAAAAPPPPKAAAGPGARPDAKPPAGLRPMRGGTGGGHAVM